MRYRFNHVEIDTQQFVLSVETQPLAIEPKVFDLIVYLIEHRQRLVSRDELFNTLWAGREVSDTTLSNHIKSARKALGDNAERQAVIRTLRGRGYQFIADLHTNEGVGEISDTSTSADTSLDQTASTETINAAMASDTKIETDRGVTPEAPSGLQARLYQAVIAALLAIIATMLLFSPTTQEDPDTDRHALSRIAVLPLHNLEPNATTDYLGFAIADQIIGELTRLSGLTVRGSSSVRQYQNNMPAPEAVAESLAIDYLLNGTYRTNDDALTLNIELIDINTHQLLWRETLTTQTNQAFTIQTQIAQQLIAQLPFLDSDQHLDTRKLQRPSNALAYELYLRAIATPTTNQGALLALKMLEQAKQLDPNYAPIYAELGQRTHFLAVFNFGGDSQTEQAIAYYRRALALAPNLHMALSSLAKIHVETGETAKAIELSRHLVTLNPKDAQAHFSLGYSYRYAGMIEQSIEHMKIAIELDPKPRWSHTLSISYLSLGQYDKAMAALDVGADTPYSLGWKASIHLHQGQDNLALTLLDRVIEMEPDSFWEYDSQGFKAYITQDIETGLAAARKLEAAQVNDSEATFYWATLYALLGEKEGALRMLKKAVSNGYFNYPLFLHETHLDSLRQNPEFLQLLDRVKDEHLSLRQHLER